VIRSSPGASLAGVVLPRHDAAVTDRLALPARPAPPEPPPFPVIGVIAPVVLAVGLFVVLGTPTVLLLAVFSPVLAIAAVLDGRLQQRRRGRREQRRQDAALTALERELEVLRSAAVAAAHAEAPSPAALAADPDGWAGRPPSGVLVLGTAELPCSPVVSGVAAGDRERRLLAASAVLPGAPLVVPADTSVAVVGPAPLADAFARAVSVARLRGSGSSEGAGVLPATAGATADLVVEVGADAVARVVHASGPATDCPARVFRPAFLTVDAHRAAVAQGAGTGLAELLARPAAGGLAARFLVGADGPVDIDLVRDGPHAVVGGTTGSGKSALLTAWILALAAAHPPERLVLLLVDCKGGAAFDPLAALPHVAGVVTDLDPEATERAVASLAAELRRREQALREAGAADVAGTALPRLVVVVDEYRALVDRAPALAALFGDLASRGRSLGVHLVLCTQRPAGSIRDEVLANCPIRISLRVHDAADSRALVGSDAAARLGREPVGAAILLTERPVRVRVAAVDERTVQGAVGATALRHAASSVRPPWLPPLPPVLPLEALPAPPPPLVALGLTDLPEEQRQPVLAWDPVSEPRLLVVGDPRTGRTTALATAARGLGERPLAADPALLWDRIGGHGAPLLVDDLDHLLDRLGDAHRAPALERLAARLRDPGAAPTVVTLRGPSAWAGLPLRGVLGLFDETVLLGLGLEDHLALGGVRATWTAASAPGRGWCAGARVQLGRTPPLQPREPPAPDEPPRGPLTLLSTRPRLRGEALVSSGWRVLPAAGAPKDPEADVAVVGAPADWQTEWRALAALRRTSTVLVDGCGAGDLRALLGVTDPLPPVTHPDDVVLIPSEGAPRRVRLRRPERGSGTTDRLAAAPAAVAGVLDAEAGSARR
jgi:S-DNA-T family DNA segregation ATPase FtsK/SpoIIIE